MSVLGAIALAPLMYFASAYIDAYERAVALVAVHRSWNSTVIVYGGLEGFTVSNLGRLLNELLERVRGVEGVLYAFAVYALGTVNLRVDDGIAVIGVVCVNDPAVFSLMPNPFLPFSLKEGRLPRAPGEALVVYAEEPGSTMEVETRWGRVKLVVPELRVGDTLRLSMPAVMTEYEIGEWGALERWPHRYEEFRLVNVTFRIVGVAGGAPVGGLFSAARGLVTLLTPCSTFAGDIDVKGLEPYVGAVLVEGEPGRVVERVLELARGLGVPLRRAEPGVVEPLTVLTASAVQVPVRERALEKAETYLSLAVLLGAGCVASVVGPQVYAVSVLRRASPLLAQAGIVPWQAQLVAATVTGYAVTATAIAIHYAAAALAGWEATPSPALTAALALAPLATPLASTVKEAREG